MSRDPKAIAHSAVVILLNISADWTLPPFSSGGAKDWLLSLKDGGALSTASYNRACRCEAPEGYHLFRYKDNDTECIGHMLDDLQDYGVTKKWVIITEISKESENNTIGRLNA